jgi:rod shape-determining protein MreC
LFGALVLLTGVTMLSDQRSVQTGGRDHPWWSSGLLEIAAPLQKTLELPIDMARDLVSGYLTLVNVNDENQRLRERIAQLEEENVQFREALLEGGRLQRIVEMRGQFETPMRPGQVVGEDVSLWFRSVLLDRGRQDDIRAGMPVVTDRGLVGLVTATTPHTARVMLLPDRQSAVDGIVQRSRAKGIVRGSGTERLEFTFLVRGDDVREGDVVITSGVGGVYPKGLRIGEVVQVDVDEDRLLHTATLKPVVDFGRLEQVFVMLRRGPTMELLHEAEEEATQTAARARGPE